MKKILLSGLFKDDKLLSKLARYMKLIFILVFICSLHVSAKVYSQERFTLSMNNVSIEKVLNKIQKESDYRFFYNSGYLKHLEKVSISVKDETLSYILDELLDNTLSFRILEGNLVVISPEGSHAIQHKVEGIITDDKGKPLAGVSVQVKGTNLGVTTNAAGEFVLVVPENAVLTFSFVGYVTQEVTVGNRTDISVQLIASASELNQVVVVGYGTQKKVDLTGAVSQIDSKMIEDRPVDNVGQALQGVVANLNINFSDGRPGAPASVNIRGFTSINGGQPLILIDGVPGDINLLNPQDIKSLTVLKDASSAAIYGARAAYGVILITTKSGQSGKLRVTYSTNFSIGTPTTSHDFMTDGYSTAKLIDSAFKVTTGNSYTNYTAADYDSLKLRQTNHSLPSTTIQNRNGQEQYVWYGNTDWWHYFFHNSLPSMSHSLELSGGSDKVNFMVSGRYYQQTGMIKFDGDKYTSYNLRAKVNAHIKSWLTISNNLQFATNTYNWPGVDPVDEVFTEFGVHMLPSYVPVNPDGTFTYRSQLNNYGIADGYNLEIENGKSISQQQEFDMTNTFSITLQPTRYLSIVGSYSYDLNPYSSYARSVVTPWSINPGVIEYFNNDTYSETSNIDQYHVANAYATFQKSFGEHSLKVITGYNQELKKYHELDGSADNLLSPDLNSLDLGTSGQVVGSNSVEWALLGFFGRINYSYKDKYLLELDGRYDGTSHFPAGSRFGFFPSVSAGWRISQESFFKPLKNIISELKIRGSYGTLGNQSLSTNLRADNYPYIPLMNTGLSSWLMSGNKSQYLDVGSPISPELTWERTKSADGGIDMSLLNNRLSATFDWYDRKTLGMLIPGLTLPAVFGASSPTQNAGNLDTRGWELSMKWNNSTKLAGRTLSFNFGIVLSDSKSYITKFDNPTKLLSNYYPGERVGQIWGYTVNGFFQTDEEAQDYKVDQSFVNKERLSSPGASKSLQAGDLKFVDINGDGIINNGQNTLSNHGDLKVIGNNLPRFPFGITGGASWNGFDISFFLQGIAHQNWYPGTDTYFFWGPYARPYYSFIPKNFENRMWSPQNPNAYFPKLRGYVALNANSELTSVNTRYLQNIAYIRLKNLTIGYNLPATLLQRWKIDRIRIYLSGENIFTASPLKSKYIDPEQVSEDPNGVVANVDARNYPFMKNYSAGFDLTF